MKKFTFFFLITVFIMTFILTRPKKIEEHVVTENEISQYRDSILANPNYNVSENSVNAFINSYIQINTRQAGEEKGMEFGSALKFSAITVGITYAVLFLIYFLKNAQYNELFGSSFGGDNTSRPLQGLRRFFFGRWF